MLNQERLKEKLHYDEDSGLFYWNNVPKHSRYKGLAGCLSSGGYRIVTIDKVIYFCHRLVWLYVFGEFPENQIDHIDNDKLNNKLSNLRESTHKQNQRNRQKPRNNKSGFKGVTLDPKTGKYRGCVYSDKFNHYCGSHATAELANEAVKLKRIELHGEFYNHG